MYIISSVFMKSLILHALIRSKMSVGSEYLCLIAENIHVWLVHVQGEREWRNGTVFWGRHGRNLDAVLWPFSALTLLFLQLRSDSSVY